MRVLLLTLDFLPNTGGVARYLDDLAHYFGEEITVVAPESSVEVDRPYRIERTKILGDVVWPKWLRAVWVLLGMRREYDHILISHVLPLGTAARVAFWFTGKPYSIFVHGLDLSFAKRTRVKRWITTRVLLEAANIFANSRALADEVKNDFRVERVHTVYPVVSERPVYEEEPIGEEDSVIRLLTVARLVARKGHVRVLRAMKALRERGMTLHYHIVGDGPMREEIEELALELQLDHAVTIEHSASDEDVQKAYARADVFVMPTRIDPVDREGFGIAYLEAAMHGVPSIASRMPGVDEAVLHNETGLLIDSDDDLLRALVLLAGDQALRERLGAAARHRAKTQFHPDAQLKKIRDLL